MTGQNSARQARQNRGRKTRQDRAGQLLAGLTELAQDETLSEEEATVLVAGLLGVLGRMRKNPAWRRVIAKTQT